MTGDLEDHDILSLPPSLPPSTVKMDEMDTESRVSPTRLMTSSQQQDAATSMTMNDVVKMMKEMQEKMEIQMAKQVQDMKAQMMTLVEKPIATPSAKEKLGPSSQSPASNTSGISPRQNIGLSEVFKNFKFCPSPRKEQCPKNKVCLRDQTFAISSAQGIACLEAEFKEGK